MSKVHYKVDSRKNAKIEKNQSGRITMLIEDVVRVEVNEKIKVDNGAIMDEINNGGYNKWKLSDLISVLLYAIALVNMFVLFFLLAFGKDIGIWESSNIDNLIGLVALLFAISSIPIVKEFLNRKLSLPLLWNKLWYFLMVMCIPFYIVFVMDWIGVSFNISNICGVFGIVICSLTWGK